MSSDISSVVGPSRSPSRLADIRIFDIPPETVRSIGDQNSQVQHVGKIFGLVRSTERPAPKLYYPCLEAQTSQLAKIRSKSEYAKERMDWDLPGKGEVNTKEINGRVYTCGERVRVETCPDTHYIKSVPCHCHKISCPICFDDAIRRAVRERLTPKFDNYSILRESEGKRTYTYHVELSLPAKKAAGLTWYKNGFDNNRRTAIRLLTEDIGALGGALFFHPFREPPKNQTVWRVGPHYHAILCFDHPVTAGFLNDFIPEFQERTGWVCHFIRATEDPSEELRMFPDVIGGTLDHDGINTVATYVLSHVGVSARVPCVKKDSTKMVALANSVYYFGEIVSVSEIDSHTIVRASSDEPLSYVRCPYCSKPLYDYDQELIRHYHHPSYTPVPLLESRKIHVWSMLSKAESRRFSDDFVIDHSGEFPDARTTFIVAYAYAHDSRFRVYDDMGNRIPPDSPIWDDRGGLDLFGRYTDGLAKYLGSLPNRFRYDDSGGGS